MSNLFDEIGKGITDAATGAIAPTGDHTVPRKAKWFGYPLIALMAWRTGRILFRAVPHDMFGYAFAVIGLFATEIGSLFWYDLMTKHAHEEKGNDQRGIAMFMFAGDFILSVVTTIADITDATGYTVVTQTEWAMPAALIGAGVWAIVNFGAWLWYRESSPVVKAEREQSARTFALQVEKRKTSDEIASLAEKVRLREEQIAAKERLLSRVEEVEGRAKNIGSRLDAWSKGEMGKIPEVPEIPKEEMITAPAMETVKKNGHTGNPT